MAKKKGVGLRAAVAHELDAAAKHLDAAEEAARCTYSEHRGRHISAMPTLAHNLREAARRWRDCGGF